MSSREDSYLVMLKATALIQDNVSRILEAKVEEAKISRTWISSQLWPSVYGDNTELYKHSLDIQEHLIKVIDGIANMELSLARNLKIVLNREEQSSSYGDYYGSSGDSGASK